MFLHELTAQLNMYMFFIRVYINGIQLEAKTPSRSSHLQSRAMGKSSEYGTSG
jgi:hypothetical protein